MTTFKTTGPLSLDHYDRTKPPGEQNGDKTFLDAMHIREEVFVKEQNVPLENELDDMDPKCVHIVLYTKDKPVQPIGTIRILPVDDQLPTILDKHRAFDASPYTGPIKSSIQNGQPFITLGRLAILKQYRGHGYAELLVQIALQQTAKDFNGLVMVHAQHYVQRFWRKCGFETDEAFGIWDEEGIDHVAMFRRI